MSDKIKIAYSWIGPRGPIINTELPNILSFAAVAEGTNTTSHRFWADDLWWRVFHENGPFELSSVWGLDQNHTFIYPYTLTWRVPFDTYFYPTSGIIEFSHTPGHILHHVRTSKGYFLVDLSAEAFIRDDNLESLHRYFSSNHVPMGKVIYLTGCMNASTVYNEWCNRKGISENNMERMLLVSFPISQHSISTNMWQITEPEYNTELVPQKVFLSWNRRFRNHRTALVLGLEKAGLVDRSYISMGRVDPENSSFDFSHTINNHLVSLLCIESEWAISFLKKLPLVLDGETRIELMCQDFDSAARDFYTNSLVSIVTETNFEDKELTLTEKSFKPSKEKHPFIIVGVTGALKAMRELGFKTFSDFWDESYDDTQNHVERLSKIIEVAKYISTWDNDKILDFKRRVKPILDHNFQVLKSNTARIAATNIAEHIRKLTP